MTGGFDQNKTYISEKLTAKINSSINYPVTMINAPYGYGKSTLIHEFASGTPNEFKLINITTGSLNIFWSDLCDVFSNVCTELEDVLKNMGAPKDEKTVSLIRSGIKKCTLASPFFVIIDNCQLLNNQYIDLLLTSVYDILPKGLHLIIVTESFLNPMLNEFMSLPEVLTINRKDFIFTTDSIQKLYKINNKKISSKEAENVLEISQGWISAIRLLIPYSSLNELHKTISSFDELIEKTIWQKLNDQEKKYLIVLSLLDNFTIYDAVLLTNEKFNQSTIIDFLNSISFIRFDHEKKIYEIQLMVKDFLLREFSFFSNDIKKEIYLNVGKIHEQHKQLFLAYQSYYKAQEWELIYQSVPSFDDLYPYICNENRMFFTSLVSECPKEILSRHYYFPIIMCFVLFMYNDKNRLLDYLMNIVYSIEEDAGLDEISRANLLGTVYYVRGYTEFNNLEIMHEFYNKSLNYSGTPVKNLTFKVPFTFGCPSIMHMFHRIENDVTSELKDYEDCMISYQELADSHGKGSVALFKAEVAYNQCDFKTAEILCHEAMYLSDTKDQTDVLISSYLLLAKMTLQTGDFKLLTEIFETAHKKVSSKPFLMDKTYSQMADICRSTVLCICNYSEGITPWLTDWEIIDSELNMISKSYAAIIHLKWLYLNKDYQKLLGLYDLVLGISSNFNCALPRIYCYIFAAMANEAVGNTVKACKMLKIAITLCEKNNFYMPFVENYEYLEALINKSGFNSTQSTFFNIVAGFAKHFEHGKNTIIKKLFTQDNYGLTGREAEVARLAAKRLSNKEIAQTLFITENTVKSNLKNVFAKLGIASRSELSNYFND